VGLNRTTVCLPRTFVTFTHWLVVLTQCHTRFGLHQVYTLSLRSTLRLYSTAAPSAERSVWLADWVEKDSGIDDAAARDSDVQDRGRKADQ
jgi:hypothetical protein